MNPTHPTRPCTKCQETDAPLADEVTRRRFLTQGALATVSLLLSTTACAGPSTGTTHVNLTINISNFPALASVGGVARVDAGTGTPVAAVRTGDASFAAFSLVCPHFGCTVGVYNGVTPPFQCPCHGAEFSANGQWYGGQPTGHLRTLTTNYDSTTGMLTIT